jgi:uncharacterized membrane protein YfcA
MIQDPAAADQAATALTVDPSPSLVSGTGRSLVTARGLLGCATLAALCMGAAGPHPVATVVIMVTVGLAAVVSSTVGFAHSAIAGVLVYRLADSPLEAVTILMACSLAIQTYSVAHLWRDIRWRRLVPFLAGGLVTLVPGCWLALHTPARTYLLGLGAFLTVYGVYMLVRRAAPPAGADRSARAGDVLAGALGGLTGPLAAFPSLPVTIWLARRGWEKVEQRAVYQPFIVVLQLGGLLVLSAMGGGSPLRLDRVAYAVPALLGCSLGLDLFRRLSTARFNAMVHLLVALSGAALALR